MGDFEQSRELETVAELVSAGGSVAICGKHVTDIAGRLCSRLIPARPCASLSEVRCAGYPAVVITDTLPWPYAISLVRMERALARADRIAVRISGVRATTFTPDMLHDRFIARGFRLHPMAHRFSVAVDGGYWVIMERIPASPKEYSPVIVVEDTRRGGYRDGIEALQRMQTVAEITFPGSRVFAYGCGVGDDVHSLQALSPSLSITAIARSYETADYALNNYDSPGITYVPAFRMSISRTDQGSADVFLATKALMSLPDYALMIHNAMRIIAPGGRLVICVPPRLQDVDTGKVHDDPEIAVADMLADQRDLGRADIVSAGGWSIIMAARKEMFVSEVPEERRALAAA